MIYNKKIYFSVFILLFLLANFGCKQTANSQNIGTAEVTNMNSQIKLFAAANLSESKDLEQKENTGFEKSAKENSKSQYNLKWTFGRKNQTGWYLYVPLIQHEIGTEENADAAEFAKNLSIWQKAAGLSSNGIFDAKTMLEFVKLWQSRRLKNIVEATDDLLFFAPIADFYDPTRDPTLLGVEKETYSAYKKMIQAAMKDENLRLRTKGENLADAEKFLKIVSSYRSSAYQQKLREREPNAGRAALAFKSPHFTGRALDIYVGGEPVTTKDFNRAIQIKTPVYLWLVKNAEKFGFYPYFYEPWHWEYVGK